jgi:hypothetical protein
VHALHFTVERALGFSVFTSRIVATHLIIETGTVSLSHTLQILHLNEVFKSHAKSSHDELSVALSYREHTWTELHLKLKTVKWKSRCDWRSVSQSVSKSWCRAPSAAYDQIFITVWQLQSCFYGAPSLTRGRVCLLYMLLVLARAVFLGPSPLGLATIFYSLRFETSFFVTSYD